MLQNVTKCYKMSHMFRMSQMTDKSQNLENVQIIKTYEASEK